MSSADKFRGGHVRGRNALFFEVDYIVRTARNAGPSIAKGFNDRITLLGQFRLDWRWRWTCDCGFHTA